MENSDNLPDPAVLAREIVESLETALEQFRGIEDELKEGKLLDSARLAASDSGFCSGCCGAMQAKPRARAHAGTGRRPATHEQPRQKAARENSKLDEKIDDGANLIFIKAYADNQLTKRLLYGENWNIDMLKCNPGLRVFIG